MTAANTPTTVQYTHHMCMSVEGALRSRRSMKGVFTHDDGRQATDREARNHLRKLLADGKVVIPLCRTDECPGFDYAGKGCPGHPQYGEGGGK